MIRQELSDKFLERDGTLGLGDSGVLIPKHVRPKPSINGFLVGLQYVLSQDKSGMKKRLIVLVCSVRDSESSPALLPDQN
jgi:hypothetical protein